MQKSDCDKKMSKRLKDKKDTDTKIITFDPTRRSSRLVNVDLSLSSTYSIMILFRIKNNSS